MFIAHKSRAEHAHQLEMMRREGVKKDQAQRVLQIRLEAMEQELARERARAEELAAVRRDQSWVD